MHETFEQTTVEFVLIMLFVIIFLWMLIKAAIKIGEQDNERERIKRMPNSLREGRLLIKRQDPKGGYQDLSFDLLELGNEDSEVNELPEGNMHKQVRWQPRNHRKTGRELEVYRGNYPSKARAFYREEDE